MTLTSVPILCQCGNVGDGYGHPKGGWGRFEENGFVWCPGPDAIVFADKFTCGECGEMDRISAWATEYGVRLFNAKRCHTCYFWDEKVGMAFQDDVVRVSGSHFIINPDVPPGEGGFRGFGGREFQITFFDGRRAVTKNLWSQGAIPDSYRSRLPDNARFVYL